MHIVYTVNGEGMGHATRSSVVIEHLLQQGHTVTIFSGGQKVTAFLNKKYSNVIPVTGMHMVYRDNKVRRLQTAVRVVGNMTGIRKDLATIRKHCGVNRPEVVITDFDYHGEIAAHYYHVPLISIDNIQYITQAKFHVAPEDFINYELNFLTAKTLVPRADHYIITTIGTMKLKKQSQSSRVTFVPPLLRDKVLAAESGIGEHILVYQTSDSYAGLLEVLAESSERFLVYNTQKRHSIPNVTCRAFDEDIFINDLASAKAVIVNGGFTVISESLFLQKPVLSIPISNHFEQKVNGMMIRDQGLGMMVKRLSQGALESFVQNLDGYKKNIAQLTFDNAAALKTIDATIALVTS
jgi:uncharacterized protein (TIGR00661 family)